MKLKLEIVTTHTIVVDDMERSVCSPQCEHIRIGGEHIVPGPRECCCTLYNCEDLAPVDQDGHARFIKECRAAAKAETEYVKATTTWHMLRQAEVEHDEPEEPVIAKSTVASGPFRSYRCEACISDHVNTAVRAEVVDCLRQAAANERGLSHKEIIEFLDAEREISARIAKGQND